jgi:hypothetical protein
MSKLVNGMNLEQHAQAAREAGLSLEGYAREHGFPVEVLYRAHKRLKQKARIAAPADQLPNRGNKPAQAAIQSVSPSFAPIEVITHAMSMKARLPNGIELEFSSVDSSWAVVAQTLASLPCSR